MLEEDREAIRKMKADFEAIAELAENGFRDHSNFQRRMNHYNTVYMCATRNAPKASEYPGYDACELLYMDYQEMLTRYLLKYRDLSATSESELFQKILNIWAQYKFLMKWNIRAFGYLSRYYIVNHSKPSLAHVGLSIFLEQIFKKNVGVVNRVAQDLLRRERAGEASNHTLIASAIDLFSSMSIEGTQSVYNEEFLTPFLSRTRLDYEELLEEWSDSAVSASKFLELINLALANERERCRAYFNHQDEGVIMSCVEGVLIGSAITQAKLLHAADGFQLALRNRDEAHLRQYNGFLSRNEAGVAQLALLVRKEIEMEGTELSLQHEGEETSVDVTSYVTSMMQLQEVFASLLSRSFQFDFTITKAVREGLEVAYNGGVQVSNRASGEKRVIPFCEWLAHYADIVLQRERGDNIEAEIERIVAALAYVTERDRFWINSRDRMAERILFSKRFNEANERLLIQRIRQRCGPASTASLEGMLHDLDVSNGLDIMEQLRTRWKEPPFTVSLLVTKKGIWPTQRIATNNVIMPTFLQRVLDNMKEVYLAGTSGRLLTWWHESSSAEIRWTVAGRGSCSLSVSGIQALTLLAFNNDGHLSLLELAERYGLPIEALQYSIPPLIKTKILQRPAEQLSLQPSSQLRVNSDLAFATRKMRLTPTLVRISVAQSAHVDKQVEEDRKPAVDACLVRLMKSRKEMAHADLVEESQKQLLQYFSPDVKLIKVRIEELIRREYLERDPKNNTMYRYVA